MVAAGLLNAGRAFDLPVAIETGLEVAKLLLDLANEDGGIAAISAKRGDSSERGSSWSTEGRAHELKLVQALLLADEVGLEGAVEAADRLVAWGVREQKDDGRFITQPNDDLTMLHPHLYAIEGLWIWGTARQDADALARARLALDWVWRQQLETGGFPRHVSTGVFRAPKHSNPPVEQIDATAQATRAALLLGRNDDAVEAAIRRLVEVAKRDGEGSSLIYQPSSPQMHLNMWATMFGAQALELFGSNASPISWRDVV